MGDGSTFKAFPTLTDVDMGNDWIRTCREPASSGGGPCSTPSARTF